MPVSLDFTAAVRALELTGDSEAARVARMLRSVSGRRFRPDEDAAERAESWQRVVGEDFPTPFAQQFARYVAADAAVTAALAAYHRLPDDAARAARGEAVENVSIAFNTAFMILWDCWRQIAHFVPFILLADLQRIDDAQLRAHAGAELKRALLDYRRAYASENSEERVEAFQRDLLVSLLRVFRKLEREKALPDEFVFSAVLEPGQTFDDLFPERFDAALLFLQQVRNRVIHGQIGNRYPDVVEPLRELVRIYFYQLIAVLAPLSRAFGFGYVEALEAAGEVAHARVSLFVGAAGPYVARYLASTATQLDHFEFESRRLYLIARAKAAGGGDTASVLETKDYLDLTPFLIVEHLPKTPGDDRDVLALDQYGAISRLLYQQLAGQGKAVIERVGERGDPSARLQAARNENLFAAIAAFVNRIAELTAMVTVRDASLAKVAEVRERLWNISRESTKAILDADRFSSGGREDPNASRRGDRATYDPDLYIEPPEIEVLRRFLDGEKRAVVLTGPSGYGKSNLLAHLYLQRCRDDRPAVFLTGRLLRRPLFRDDLVAHVTSLIYGAWGLDELAGFLRTNYETLTVFVDAVNEYTGEGGPLALLYDMLEAIKFDDRLERCRFVISTRTETWSYYKEAYGERPLDKDVFETASGDALSLGSFDDDARRKDLYDRYRAFYALQPERYGELSRSVRALVARPYLMALVAETYSNRGAPADSAEPPRRIPRVLDYLTVFHELTERRVQDAQNLLPPGDERRGALPDAMLDFFMTFTREVYERLSAGAAREGGSTPDALPRNVVAKFSDGNERLTVLQAALQSGLLINTTMPQRNALGRLVDGRAYAFFHDQYAQFWLAQFYRAELLADVTERALDDPARRAAIAERLVEMVAAATAAPIVGGGLEYWLDQLQRTVGLRRVMDLLSEMSVLRNGAARHFVAAALTGFVLRASAKPDVLYACAFERGTPSLGCELGAAFLDYWPDLDREATRAFIEAANLKESAGGKRDLAAIESLAESFAALFINEADGREGEASRVLDFLRETVPGIEPRALLSARHVEKYLVFLIQFSLKSILGLAFDLPSMRGLGAFLRVKLGLVLGLIVRLRRFRGPVLETLRRPLWGLIEQAGLTMWDRTIAQGANDRFFVDDDGVNQNLIEREFMPYVCALHNREFALLDLGEGTEYRRLVLLMLRYRPNSAIGYTAMATLPFALQGDWPRARGLIDELLATEGEGARFFATQLLVNLTYTEPELGASALDYAVDDVLPLLLGRGLAAGELLLVGVGIAEQNPDALWPALERGLRRAFEHYESTGDWEAAEELCADLVRVNFFQQLEIAKRTIRLVCALNFLDADSRWRGPALKILAGMRVRNPLLLRNLLEGRADADELVMVTSGLLDREAEKEARDFGYETSWNPLVQRSLAGNTKLRYLMLKYLVAGLAGCNSVPQYARSWRQFVVESIAAYFGPPQPESAYARLTREDWEAAVETTWRADAGEPWPSNVAAGAGAGSGAASR